MLKRRPEGNEGWLPIGTGQKRKLILRFVMVLVAMHYIFLFVSHYGHLSSQDLTVDVASNVKNIFRRNYGTQVPPVQGHLPPLFNSFNPKKKLANEPHEVKTTNQDDLLTEETKVRNGPQEKEQEKPPQKIKEEESGEKKTRQEQEPKGNEGKNKPVQGQQDQHEQVHSAEKAVSDTDSQLVIKQEHSHHDHHDHHGKKKKHAPQQVESRQNDTSPALILYWNAVSGFLGQHMMVHPPCSVKCEYSEDHADLHRAEGVFFHFVQPPFEVPGYKTARQKWIAFCMESEINYPILRDNELLDIFDIQMTYHLRSHIVTYYMNWEVNLVAKAPPAFSERTAKAPVVTVISNCHASNDRMSYVEELSKYIAIDKYGACFGRRFSEFTEIMKSHKFFLSFENSNIEDYVTEKAFRAWEYGIVPVYMGAPNIDDFAPSNHSVIKTTDFQSAKELGKYLLELSKDEKKYSEYLTWKTDPSVHTEKFKHLHQITRVDTRCLLCEKIIKERHINSKTWEPQIPRSREGAPESASFSVNDRTLIKKIRKSQLAQSGN